MTAEQSQQRALTELQTKSIEQIQSETAYIWAYRAWAARELGLTLDASEYFHEALEHAALTGSDDTLREVRRIGARRTTA